MSYEELHKQARRLEGEIDMKLITFNKTCAGRKSKVNSSLTEPLLSSDHVVESASMEMEDLLQKLTGLNDKMASVDAGGNRLVPHTLQRHREILQDYSSEYRKTINNYKARRDKEELMDGVQKDLESHKLSMGLNRRNEMFLKENEHIRSSDRLIDDQISIAVETRENLMSQRLTMKKLQTRMHDLSNRFPLVNSLIQRINLRKRRDSLVLGLVVFICTFLLLFYAFH
ncbi:Succinyl-CoA:3-ketoacid-coenzyme A transferase [Nesidiocoris tenuis]|uniref:Golgi SNAP receptor complex member 1 n=1 Tax=Nesidiocoris tenuis TaxID=355587 RepID=A0ABN7AGP1_9HEMI|nr:Succinyl-CoA:3-ketoacid-coenzyme A transferase [Nesidiocoris tenuis]